MSAASPALYAGIDVGGTTIKSSLVTASGTMFLGPEAVTSSDVATQLTDLAVTLAAEHPELRGIGIVTPGIVDDIRGIVTYCANLDLHGIPLARLVESATGIPTRLGHDGRAAGMAEAALGAGRGAQSFVMIPIGTGISAAIFADNHTRSGATFCAGEIGHSPVYPGGEPCGCGQQGCLETYASASAIGRRYYERTGQSANALEVEKRLHSDPVARQVWQEAVEALALGLTHLTLSFDPELIIIGGGLSGAGEKLLQPLRLRVSDLLAWRRPPRLTVAALGDQAGRWGAALLGAAAAGITETKEWRA